jgi:hypothetical protein
LVENPYSRLPLALRALQAGVDRSFRDHGVILSQAVLESAADGAEPRGDLLQKVLRRAALLPLAQDQAGPQDDRVLEADLLHVVFELALHLRVRHHGRARRAAGRDEHVRVDAGLLGGLGQVQVQVVVDLALLREPAGLGAGGAEPREEGGRGGRGGEGLGPGLRVGGLDGLELGGLLSQGPPAERVDGAVLWRIEDDGQDVGSLLVVSAEGSSEIAPRTITTSPVLPTITAVMLAIQVEQ